MNNVAPVSSCLRKATMNIVTVTGIRPDFIRMSEIFKKLDNDPDIRHILIHTGQHFDQMLSGVFFNELDIREPDYNLECGGGNHIEQNAKRDSELFKLIQRLGLDKDDTTFVFLGDSNSVLSAVCLRKDGWKVAHIEAGQRSGDMRMLEEINRIIADSVSNQAFCYHADFVSNLKKENYRGKTYITGNTIVEPVKKYADLSYRRENHILVDIHRPENFLHPKRMSNILDFCRICSKKYNLPIKLLSFRRTLTKISENGLSLSGVESIPLVGYIEFIRLQQESLFLISDSGTAQEEPAIIDVPVIVPRDYTERPQSVDNGCSVMLDVNNTVTDTSFIDRYLKRFIHKSVSWLGAGQASNLIVTGLKEG